MDGSTPDGHDLSFSAALEAANRDWAALRIIHTVTWTLDFHGQVVWTCSCPGNRSPYNSQALDKHILDATAKARGPQPRKK